ncbi:unnamed protein product, partial [Cyprideis torosa]
MAPTTSGATVGTQSVTDSKSSSVIIGVPPPPPFFETPGVPNIPWRTWIEIFLNYLTAIGLSTTTEESRARAVILSCLGAEGQRIYYGFSSNSTSFEQTKTSLAAYFEGPSSKWSQRRSQMPNESVDAYCAELRTLASRCSFESSDNPLDDALVCQFICGTTVSRLREKLLLEGDALTFSKTVKVAKEYERVYKESHHKCREEWSYKWQEVLYVLLIDCFLLIVPLAIMTLTYTMISCALWKDFRVNEMSPDSRAPSPKDGKRLRQQPSCDSDQMFPPSLPTRESPANNGVTRRTLRVSNSEFHTHSSLRQSNPEKGLKNRKRVVKMLFAVVICFFICWTPLHAINTWVLIDKDSLYDSLGNTGILGLYSLAYVSCCCNPITYCFMNSSFRKAFLAVLGCNSHGSNGMGIARAGTVTRTPGSQRLPDNRIRRSRDFTVPEFTANRVYVLPTPSKLQTNKRMSRTNVLRRHLQSTLT